MTTPIIGGSSRNRSVLIAGDHNVAKLFPMWNEDVNGVLRVWAERGYVCTEYDKTDGYKTMPWRDAAERTLALSEMVGKSNKAEAHLWPDERERLLRFIEQMNDIIRQAKEHGDPFTKGAGAERKRRGRTTVAVNPRKMDNIIVGDPLKSI